MPQRRVGIRRTWHGGAELQAVASRLMLPALSTLPRPDTTSCWPTEMAAGVRPLAATPSSLTTVALPTVTVALFA